MEYCFVFFTSFKKNFFEGDKRVLDLLNNKTKLSSGNSYLFYCSYLSSSLDANVVLLTSLCLARLWYSGLEFHSACWAQVEWSQSHFTRKPLFIESDFLPVFYESFQNICSPLPVIMFGTPHTTLMSGKTEEPPLKYVTYLADWISLWSCWRNCMKQGKRILAS